MAFSHRIRPRYGEVDLQGVVFNAHWLTYFDETVTRFFESLGFPPKETFENDFDFMVVRATIEWKGPAGFDDVVVVEASPCRLGNSSFDVRYLASVDGRAACEATITYVSINPGTNQSRPIPEVVRKALEAGGV